MGQPRVSLFQSGKGSDQGSLAKRVCLALSQNPHFIVVAITQWAITGVVFVVAPGDGSHLLQSEIESGQSFLTLARRGGLL